MKKYVLTGSAIGSLIGMLLLAAALSFGDNRQSFLEAGLSNQIFSLLMGIVFSGLLCGSLGWYVYNEVTNPE